MERVASFLVVGSGCVTFERVVGGYGGGVFGKDHIKRQRLTPSHPPPQAPRAEAHRRLDAGTPRLHPPRRATGPKRKRKPVFWIGVQQVNLWDRPIDLSAYRLIQAHPSPPNPAPLSAITCVVTLTRASVTLTQWTMTLMRGPNDAGICVERGWLLILMRNDVIHAAKNAADAANNAAILLCVERKVVFLWHGF